MRCHVCGQENPDNATSCGRCGAAFANPYQPPGGAMKINNYLVPAIFATLCCCLPFGIVSIVYAAQVNPKLAGGDVAGAVKSASNAKMWFWISFGLGLVIQLAYLGIVAVGIVADAARVAP